MSQARNKRNKKTGLREGKSVSRNKLSVSNSPKKRPVNKQKFGEQDSIRLNKYIGNSGVCTRKDADLYIQTGSVKVNGKVVTEMGYKVKLTDEVHFDGQLIKPVEKSYILLNKPKGFTLEINSANEQKTVYSLTKNASKGFLKPVGKMERNTSGLLILSNDESFLGNLNGSGRIPQLYHVELNKPLAQVDFDKIKEGVWLDEHKLKVQKISYVEDSNKKEIGIQLNSQKNRVVTRIFESLGYKINYLDRVTYGGLTKKDLGRGNYRALTKQELINLQMQS